VKEKLLENTRRFRKTKRGVITNSYHKMRSRRPVEFTLIWLHAFSNCKKFDRLYSEWVKSGYAKEFKPSLDRINCKQDYTCGNIQWLSWSENRYKQTMERRCRKGKVLQMQGEKIIKIHKSQRMAVMNTGISQPNISSCLNGKRENAGGYGWKYEDEWKHENQNPELLEQSK